MNQKKQNIIDKYIYNIILKFFNITVFVFYSFS